MSREGRIADRSKLAEMLGQIKLLVEQCITLIGDETSTRLASKGELRRPSKSTPKALDFHLPERAFVRAYARHLSGPKKFVLLLAYLAKGKISVDVRLRDVEKHWNRMTSPSLLAGKFNRFYSNTARERGWVDTKKAGIYVLRPTWAEVLKG